MIEQCFECEEIAVRYSFIRKHLKLLLNNDALYTEFFDTFKQYFLNITLSGQSFKCANQLLSGINISDKMKKHLKNTLRRVFTNNDHFKGLIGEYILCFYYKNVFNEFLDDYGPKPRSSAEPGIDYIVFTGREDQLESIKFIAWETKTTQNSVSTRASEIYDFFSPNGSFDENIDCEIHAIQDKYEDKEDSNLKSVVTDMTRQVVERDSKLNIGACVVLTNDRTRIDTLSSFENCVHELSREQRNVTLIFFKLLERVMGDLRNQIWNRL